MCNSDGVWMHLDFNACISLSDFKGIFSVFPCFHLPQNIFFTISIYVQ